ncbi:CRM-domain containing factor CFM2, chloroplastic isoform X2 [Benincasa hispida]|uniref:CRM-domain containing factor CFM2, chloroplastic isoform X2 n=1 Tax=Benincasa hispida TaxID=102211 RepID=UPI001900106D|nr:CRM-domain containing factor CFM2, chloroplastic isoform X2 [Benincasa hispida]
MLQTHSSFTLKPLTDQSPSPFTFFPSHLHPTLISHPPKPSRFLLRCSAVDSETLPKSAIQRIADKLRSLGFTEQPPEPVSNPNSPSTPGEIFVPLPNQLPKHRVGHTIDSSWSTPENPIPEPGTGTAIKRFHELRGEVEKRKEDVVRQKKREERAPTLAELSLPEEELRRLGEIGIRLKKKVKVGKAGITEGIVNTIHEQWRRSEVVKIVCEDLCRLNMKRTHDLLERKTGGIVVWRSGSKIILYRGPNYIYPYFSHEILKNESSQGALPLYNDDGGNSETESISSCINNEKSAGPTSSDKMPGPTLIQGVGAPNRVRFQLPGEAELAEDAESLLEGLGPRFSDWWGYDPLPVDADLLPAIVPGYRKPFRLLPYGVKPKLTNDEMTSLRRLSRPLPCHFALGRNRNLQGLAAAIIQLWEKCEIAKIAVKRGVQNTNSELMAEELQLLTGGTLLSRDREFIVLYRGKDFLPFAVSSAIEQQRYIRLHKMKQMDNAPATTVQEQKLGINENGPTNESQSITEWKKINSEQRKLMSSETSMRKTSIKLSIALEKKAKAEELLAKLEEAEMLQQPEIDKEGITVEERYMLKKIGLRMKPFLLLGRRGVFDGTVENMHLHWKYRELVKIITNERSFKTVHDIAQTLETESGGILVAVERVNRSYAIIIYRGKNYKRPARLRPESLLNKKEALKRSIEAQRRKSLKLHVLKLTQNVEELKLKLDKDKGAIAMESIKKSTSQQGKEGINEMQTTGSLNDPACLSHAEDNACLEENEVVMVNGGHGTHVSGTFCLDTSANSLQATQRDNDVFSIYDVDQSNAELRSSFESVRQGKPAKVSMDTNAEFGSIEPLSGANCLSGESSSETSDAVHDVALNEEMKPSVRLEEGNSSLLLSSMRTNQPGHFPASAPQLSNKERLLLRRQALEMKKRPVLAVGKSNIITGVAKAIKEHFKKHSLAIVNVKGRAKGTSVQEIVFKLEQATGAVLVSQEPSKVILYRGWEEEDKSQDGKQNATKMENKGEAQLSTCPELLAAIRVECGLR